MLETNGMEKMKIIGGNEGLDRAITWVHVVEIPEAADWVEGGELLFITGVTIKNDVEALLKLVKSIEKKKLSGLVINVGPYIKNTPKEVIALADKLNFPIFELPFEVRLIEITHVICRQIFYSEIEEQSINNFMNEIIFGDGAITEEVIERAISYGYNPKKTYGALIIDIDEFKTYILKNKIKREEKILEIKHEVLEIIVRVLKKYNKKYMYMGKSDKFYLLVEEASTLKKSNILYKIAKDINSDMLLIRKDITVSIGVGGKALKLSEFKEAVERAQKALKIIKVVKGKNSIGVYEELGFYKLLFEMEDKEAIHEIYMETLGKLKEEELISTLEAYIEENRNIGKAAESLFIHRNTMKYRINKIENILGCDLKKDEDIFNIMLSIKIAKFKH